MGLISKVTILITPIKDRQRVRRDEGGVPRRDEGGPGSRLELESFQMPHEKSHESLIRNPRLHGAM